MFHVLVHVIFCKSHAGFIPRMNELLLSSLCMIFVNQSSLRDAFVYKVFTVSSCGFVSIIGDID